MVKVTGRAASRRHDLVYVFKEMVIPHFIE